MHKLTIIKHNGGGYVDSRDVAELIDKNHKDLLRDIRGYINIMEKPNGRNFAPVDFFVKSNYLDTKGENRPCYLVSRMGCEMIANKLIGEKGVLFTAAYVKKFNEMEKNEREAITENNPSSIDELYTAAKIIVEAMSNMDILPEKIQSLLMAVYEPLAISTAVNDGADVPRMYTAKQIAKMLGMYSMNGNPHYQAVASILGGSISMGESHKAVIVTGDENMGNNHFKIKYDKYAIEALEDWLSEMGYPSEIFGYDRTFHVLYRN